jgi:hypothetical protein
MFTIGTAGTYLMHNVPSFVRRDKAYGSMVMQDKRMNWLEEVKLIKYLKSDVYALGILLWSFWLVNIHQNTLSLCPWMCLIGQFFCCMFTLGQFFATMVARKIVA